MDQQDDLRSTQSYYDRFSPSYERERHHGYHRLIDELELELVRRYGTGRDILEAGCGTGLLLTEAARIGYTGVDWPKPYRSGKSQLEAGFARAKALSATGAPAPKEPI